MEHAQRVHRGRQDHRRDPGIFLARELLQVQRHRPLAHSEPVSGPGRAGGIHRGSGRRPGRRLHAGVFHREHPVSDRRLWPGAVVQLSFPGVVLRLCPGLGHVDRGRPHAVRLHGAVHAGGRGALGDPAGAAHCGKDGPADRASLRRQRGSGRIHRGDGRRVL